MRHAPVVRRILLRAALFLIPGSCLWALLPLVATTRLALGAAGYGVLLAALGAGAIGGAFALPQARARLSANALVAAASLIYAAALAAAAVSRNLALTIGVLLLAGVAWIAFLSNVNAALQLFLPRWVRARGLAVYQMILFGAQAVGAVIWGAMAGATGLFLACLIWPWSWPAARRRSGSGRPPDRRHGPEPGRWPSRSCSSARTRSAWSSRARPTPSLGQGAAVCRPWPSLRSRG